jgi:hypothetical protein
MIAASQRTPSALLARISANILVRRSETPSCEIMVSLLARIVTVRSHYAVNKQIKP